MRALLLTFAIALCAPGAHAYMGVVAPKTTVTFPSEDGLVVTADIWIGHSLAFAPGEYFSKLGKSKTWIRQAASKLHMPVFMTSAKSEAHKWKAIYSAIPSTSKRSFVPKTRGQHGSRALWTKFPDSFNYWAAVGPFLSKLY